METLQLDNIDDMPTAEIFDPVVDSDNTRVIIVGAGPAGVRTAHEILKRQSNYSVTLFGDEPHRPYNRVQLSALLAGEIQIEDITTKLPNLNTHPNFSLVYSRIDQIDSDSNLVTDAQGTTYPYDHLILATGSRPHIPNIPGVDQTGVYTFRNLKDAESLYNRIASSRHIVIVGGGLLGIEAARALLRAGTKISLIQQGPRLMNRQLDDRASQYLRKKVEALGITVIANSGVRKILGDGRVTGITTRHGDTIECDTALICAGIKPSINLARDSGIKVAKGVKVNDRLQTSVENIYAIGECSEHRGKTYGLVAPGFEQAAIAADVINQGPAQYLGSQEISRLKVLGEIVCSMGEVSDIEPQPFLRQWIYNDSDSKTYRKIVTYKGALIGALGFGEWPEIHRVQEAYQHNRKIPLWFCLRFLVTGAIWGENSDDIEMWPASTVVCQCNNITQGTLKSAYSQGSTTVPALCKETTAGTVCGSCKPLLEQLVGHSGPREKNLHWIPLTILSLIAAVVVAAVIYFPGIEVSTDATNPALFESIWNDKGWKQVTGFSLLGLSCLGLLMSLRKKIKNDRFGNFAHWRFFHTLLGTATICLLMFHTGLHLGVNLNRWLMVDFLAIIALGAGAALTISFSHRLSARQAQSLKKMWSWAHIYVVWPLPILLSMHILTVYYF